MEEKPGVRGKVPEERRHGENTGRVQRIVQEEVATLSTKIEHGEKLFKRVQAIGGAVVGIFLAGVLTILFLSARFAAAQDVARIVEAQAAAAQEFHVHVVSEATKMGALEAQGGNIENDYHSIREQLWRVADRVGAARVAEPAHLTIDRQQSHP